MRNITSFIIFIVLIWGIQYVLQMFLVSIGLNYLAIFIIVELVVSIIFAYLMYPAGNRRNAIKDPRFHLNIAIFFAVFVLLQIIF